MSNQIAFSWSRLDCFEQCPRRCYWQNFAPKELRIPFVENEHTRRGTEVHKMLENAVKGSDLPPALAHVKPVVSAIRRAADDGWHVETERQQGFDKEMRLTSWFANDVWLRVIFDVILVKDDRMKIIDWKTGKIRDDADQLKLFAMAGMAMYPDVEFVTTSYVWVDHRLTTPKQYTAGHYDSILDEFSERAEMIQIAWESPGDWECKPSNFNCKWCPCDKTQCEHSRR